MYQKRWNHRTPISIYCSNELYIKWCELHVEGLGGPGGTYNLHHKYYLQTCTIKNNIITMW